MDIRNLRVKNTIFFNVLICFINIYFLQYFICGVRFKMNINYEPMFISSNISIIRDLKKDVRK